jgi:hypothetical protein
MTGRVYKVATQSQQRFSTSPPPASVLVSWHCGIEGKELADELAKEGADKQDDAKQEERLKRKHIHGRVGRVLERCHGGPCSSRSSLLTLSYNLHRRPHL